MMRAYVAALLTTLALINPTYAESWERYVSRTTGFSVSLPMERFKVDGETLGRLSLSEIGGSAQLDVFEVTNTERLTMAQFERMMEAADPQRRITYRAGGQSWFVLSGYLDRDEEPMVFYAKFMLNPSGTALSAFEISYPARRKATFDALVERMENSLTSPR